MLAGLEMGDQPLAQVEVEQAWPHQHRRGALDIPGRLAREPRDIGQGAVGDVGGTAADRPADQPACPVHHQHAGLAAGGVEKAGVHAVDQPDPWRNLSARPAGGAGHGQDADVSAVGCKRLSAGGEGLDQAGEGGGGLGPGQDQHGRTSELVLERIIALAPAHAVAEGDLVAGPQGRLIGHARLPTSRFRQNSLTRRQCGGPSLPPC